MSSQPQINIPSSSKIIGEEFESPDELVGFRPASAGHGSESASGTVSIPWFSQCFASPLLFLQLHFFLNFCLHVCVHM